MTNSIFKKNVQNIFSSKNILGNHNVPGQQNTYITIFSDQNAFISSPSYFFYTPIILFYQNLQRFKAYQIICGKATSLSRDNKIMSWDRWNFYFELKVPWNGIDSQNFAQDPAGPIWTALYRYIYPEIYFTTTETHFCQMSRENKKWRNLNKWPFIDFLRGVKNTLETVCELINKQKTIKTLEK